MLTNAANNYDKKEENYEKIRMMGDDHRGNSTLKNIIQVILILRINFSFLICNRNLPCSIWNVCSIFKTESRILKEVK